MRGGQVLAQRAENSKSSQLGQIVFSPGCRLCTAFLTARRRPCNPRKHGNLPCNGRRRV